MPYKPTQRPLMDYIIISPKSNVTKERYILGAPYEFMYLEDYIRLSCFLYECGAIIGRTCKDYLNTLEKLLQIKPPLKHNSISDWQDVAEERLNKYTEKHGLEPDTFIDFIFMQEAIRLIKIKTTKDSFIKKLISKKIPLKESKNDEIFRMEKTETEMREFVLEGVGFGSRFPELTREMNGRYWAFVDLVSDKWNTLTKSFKYIDNPLEILSLDWQEKKLLAQVQFYTETFYPELIKQFEFRSQGISHLDISIGYWWDVYNYIPLIEQSMKVKGKRLLEISNYNDPGGYKNDCLEIGINVSLQFCLAVSNIMKKYKMAFADTCKLLEEKGYLIWAGNLPLYNMAGDKLWMEEKKEKPSKEETEEKISEYTSNKEIKCIFFTLVIRNQALDDRYPDGLKVFVETHCSVYNDDITTILAMAGGDLAKDIAEIEKIGLTSNKDFIAFDASQSMIFPPENNSKIDLKISWLNAYWLNGYTMVRYV